MQAVAVPKVITITGGAERALQVVPAWLNTERFLVKHPARA
jgi:hypothetical protein